MSVNPFACNGTIILLVEIPMVFLRVADQIRSVSKILLQSIKALGS